MAEPKVERERRDWWVIHEGRIVQAEGVSCDSEGNWWFPTLGALGFQVFETREVAVDHALKERRAARTRIDDQIADLLAGR